MLTKKKPRKNLHGRIQMYLKNKNYIGYSKIIIKTKYKHTINNNIIIKSTLHNIILFVRKKI